MAPKLDRAIVLGLALAEGFVEAGERVGLMGALPPRASRRIAERFSEVLADPRATSDADMPAATALAPQDEAVIVGATSSTPPRNGAGVSGESPGPRGARAIA